MEDEKKKLLYIELPNLIHRILRYSLVPFPKNKRRTEAIVNEIEKIANAECQSALANFKN